jgi:putative ABC transport system permease protein
MTLADAPEADVRPVRLAPADLLGLGLLGIRTRKLRAALSALGISIGIATMIIVTGIPASSQQALLDQLAALGTDLLQAQPVALPGGRPVVLAPESVGMVRRIGPVTAASAVADLNTTVHRSDRVDPNDDSGLTVLASRTDLLPTVHGTVQSGRFLDAATERFPTAVLGAVAATRLGIARLSPGQPEPLISVGGRWFTVIGVLDALPLFPDLDRSVLVGWDAASLASPATPP